MGYVCKLCQAKFDNKVDICTKCGGAVQQAADVKKANVSGIIALICAFIFVGLHVFLVYHDINILELNEAGEWDAARKIRDEIESFYYLRALFNNSTWFLAAISLYKHKKSLPGLIAFLITILAYVAANIIFFFLHI